MLRQGLFRVGSSTRGTESSNPPSSSGESPSDADQRRRRNRGARAPGYCPSRPFLLKRPTDRGNGDRELRGSPLSSSIAPLADKEVGLSRANVRIRTGRPSLFSSRSRYARAGTGSIAAPSGSRGLRSASSGPGGEIGRSRRESEPDARRVDLIRASSAEGSRSLQAALPATKACAVTCGARVSND
jgi:hypothetical protein